jgi:hypothetical protein
LATLLFRLRHVPDDEANEVRDLLEQNDIAFYETSAGNWGISLPAIWLPHDEDYPRARELLDVYQHERVIRMREQHQADKAAGRAETLFGMLAQDPAKVLAYLVLIGVILYISISIFY